MKELNSIHSWYSIVNLYSSRELTYEQDKLVALAGIADKMQRQKRDDNYAGMWHDDLIEQLCWFVNDNIPGKRIEPKQAPTWSWASVNGRCTLWILFRHHEGWATQILKLEKATSNTSFGSMPNAELWLSCPSLLVSEYTFADTINLLKAGKPSWAKIDCTRDQYASDISGAQPTLYILMLTYGGGLILKPTDNSQGEYERIGIWYGTYDILSDRERKLEGKMNHAQKTAYVREGTHEFNTERNVITLV